MKSCAVRDVGGVLGVAANRLVRNVDCFFFLWEFFRVLCRNIVGVMCFRSFRGLESCAVSSLRSGYSIVGCVGV